ncbi:MAG: PBP1A family penicillin-binding protein [Bacillota bacterium]|nr:PBP1A family penicillin-binding protein [Bacillota bacterium]
MTRKTNSRHDAKHTQKNQRPHKKRRVFLTIFLTLVMLGLVACLFVGGWVLSIARELPEITSDDLVSAQTSFVYDQNGVEVAALHGAENRVSVTLAEMPEELIDAVIATEDRRFYEHNGVDVRSVLRAIVVDTIDTIKNGELTFTQGASTITMQLMRNVIDENEKTMVRKVKEALLALQFEKNYDKDEILTYYLNEIYTGPNTYGMQAAAEYYFGKNIGECSISECALIIGLLRNAGYYSPYAYPERALNVRNTVLNNMALTFPDKYGERAELAKADELIVIEGGHDGADYDYPWYVDYVITEAAQVLMDMGMSESYVYSGGLNIYTSLDTSVQAALETVYADDENFPESTSGDIIESGMCIVEPSTGQIKGLIGGRVYEARRGFNRATDLIRSPGSTIKPLVVYGPAVDVGYGAGTVIDDAPTGFAGGYSPDNDDGKYQGRITMRAAIMGSRNVCAVKMLQTIGAEVGWSYGVKLGLDLVPEDAQLAMALGGLTYGVSPLQMAAAFASFANNGIYTEPYAVTSIVDMNGQVIYTATPEMEQVFSEQTAYIVTDMLTSAVSGGTGTAARISGWQTAGKTGTNGLPRAVDDPDYAGRTGTKDAWFVGYTKALAGAVWMGYDNKKDEEGTLQYLTNLYGGTYPARLFNKVMTLALENYEVQSFTRPEGVSGVTIDLKSGALPTELTPEEFIGSELYNTAFGPSGDENLWVEVEICSTTGLLAGAYCPARELKVLMSYPEGEAPSDKVADYEWYVPASTCSIHSSGSIGGGQGVQVCTDPRHQGQVFLANISSSGEGGCPEEYIQTRYYVGSYLPSKYCDLEDHAITGGTQVNSGSSSGDNGSGITFTPQVAPELETPYRMNISADGGNITVTWRATNDISTTVYVVERVVDGDTEGRQRFTTSAFSYTDANMEPGHSYSYRVYAYNAEWQVTSDWSDTVSIEL